MRSLYALAWLLFLPFAFLHLLWRARRQPEYLRHWPERLGWVQIHGDQPRLWIHAVSVGETRAAAPLIATWRTLHPEVSILLTHTTPTGRETGRVLFGEQVTQAYLPYDFPLFVSLFLKRAHPDMGVIMETELWPNLFAACKSRRTPLFLVNARLSERSARGYQRFSRLASPALQSLRCVAAQTVEDAQRFSSLGAQVVRITGNLKFDVGAPAETEHRARELRHLFSGRFIWLAASTREGEEAMLLTALDQINLQDVLLVLVPRHPQRFAEIADLIALRNRPWARRSVPNQTLSADTSVFLGDSMGEMAAYYAAADMAYIGGSLLPYGGQNLIEAAAAGCPALIGPHTWNFSEAAEQAVAAGAAYRVQDSQALVAAVQSLHDNAAKRESMAIAGRRFAEQNRGATERTMEILESAWLQS